MSCSHKMLSSVNYFLVFTNERKGMNFKNNFICADIAGYTSMNTACANISVYCLCHVKLL